MPQMQQHATLHHHLLISQTTAPATTSRPTTTQTTGMRMVNQLVLLLLLLPPGEVAPPKGAGKGGLNFIWPTGPGESLDTLKLSLTSRRLLPAMPKPWYRPRRMAEALYLWQVNNIHRNDKRNSAISSGSPLDIKHDQTIKNCVQNSRIHRRCSTGCCKILEPPRCS
jgi:hypothetical protein